MLIAAWTNFFGANLQISPKRLADGLGVNASNLRTGFADLRGWNAASTVVTTGGSPALISAYRMGRSTVSDTANWLQWTVDVDVVRSLIPTDTTEEIYFTGDGAPKRTDNVLGLPAAPGPAATRTLGIAAPTVAMTTADLVVGAGPSESRVYVDTFVNNQGRESAPGLSRAHTCLGGTTVSITALDPPPGGYPDINQRRIYCSTDGGDFLLVVEQAAGTTTATDNLARGAILQSGGDDNKPAWLEPPSSLRGLIGLWNGMIGGHFGKSRAVCVPYKPWAWPVEYQEAVFDDIVGSGRWLQNWLLLTNGDPVLVTGSSPESLNAQPLPFNWACRSKRSIYSFGHGVAWASQKGLAYMGQGGPKMITEGILSPEQWEAMAPDTMIGTRMERYYVGFYNDGARKAFMVDPINPQGIIYLTQQANGVYYDKLSDRMYFQDTGNTIKRFGGGSAAAVTFETGVVRHPSLTNPAYGMVIADSPISVVVTLWANVLQADQSHVWTQVFTGIVTTGEVFPLPSNYLSQEYQGQLVTTGAVQGLLIAEEAEDIP